MIDLRELCAKEICEGDGYQFAYSPAAELF